MIIQSGQAAAKIFENQDVPDVEISVAMIRAGVEELREKIFGTPLSDIVKDIYYAMEYERRYEASASASTIVDSK